MAVSLLDVLFTARPEPSPDLAVRLYTGGALLASVLIVAGVAGRRPRQRR